MTLFLTHALILILASTGAARQLIRPLADWIMAAILLAWGNIVATSLLLASLHRLGEPAWFFRTSLLLALLTWLAFRKITPAPSPVAGLVETGADKLHPGLLAGFILTLGPIAYASIRIACAYVPNNYDSLTYHLPRAMFYLGQNSLAHFDTGNDRQIYFPFNYSLLQLFGLTYSPPLQVLTFFNLAAWATAGVGIYRLCRLVAFRANSALIATWLALTSTQVLAQATATTNDLPTGAGLLCALVFALRWGQSRLSRDALLAGLAAGLTAGTKLTVVFFGPAAGLLLLLFAWQHLRRAELRQFFAGVRAWVLPGLLALALSAPFAVINLAEKGQWINKSYDYTLNRPFSFACVVQTAQAYGLQFFLEPLHRFTFDMEMTHRLNVWAGQTFFPHWNGAYAFSSFYLFPPDLNEDHVWFGFNGPFILLCALFCLVRSRRISTPAGWLAWVGLGWFATFFILDKWSLYNQRYFVPAVLMLSPCVAAAFDAAGISFVGRSLRLLLVVLVCSALWMAGVFLFQNTSRPYAPLWAGHPAPQALPELPATLVQRLAGQSRLNIHATAQDERIFLLMTPGRHQRFTSLAAMRPDAYNIFSEWGFSRMLAYRNIEQLDSYTVLEVPTKRSAGVEFLGTIGVSTAAQDYFGLVPQADQMPSTEGNRNVLVKLSYGPHEPNRYLHTRIRVAGLNPSDQARLLVGIEYEDHTSETLATFTTTGETPVSITKPFRRFTVRAEDQATGRPVGAINLPVVTRIKPSDVNTPRNPAIIFTDELVANVPQTAITTEGLVIADGPHPQWNLPLIRWANAPVMRLEIPADDELVRLRLAFSLRLQSRDRAGIDVFLNGRVVHRYQAEGRDTWLDATLELTPAAGKNVLEFRNVALGTEPDWLEYLELNPDVKAYVISQHQPLEQGAREHYEMFGKNEHRLLPLQHTSELVTLPDPHYYLFRKLQVEALRNP